MSDHDFHRRVGVTGVEINQFFALRLEKKQNRSLNDFVFFDQLLEPFPIFARLAFDSIDVAGKK